MLNSLLVPGAAQHDVLRCRPAIPVIIALEATGVPHLRCTAGALHRVRDTRPYLIACGLIGEPVAPVMISGGPEKKNS